MYEEGRVPGVEKAKKRCLRVYSDPKIFLGKVDASSLNTFFLITGFSLFLQHNQTNHNITKSGFWVYLYFFMKGLQTLF